MKILIAMIEPPHPFGSAASRWFYVLLKGLQARGHQVTAFATCSNPKDRVEALKHFPKESFDLRIFDNPERKGFLSKIRTFQRPYSYMFSPEFLVAWENEAAKDYDVIHLEQMWSGWLGVSRPEKSILNIHHLISVDLEKQKPSGLREKINRVVLFGTEAKLASQFRHIRTCSPRLTPILKKWNAPAAIHEIPVGIDTSLYPFIPSSRRPQAPKITLIGTMAWYPSYSAAVRLLRNLWPEIKKQVPECTLQIVGWSARSALKEFLETPGVEILENVPDTKPYFESSSVFLYAPSRGSGMKIKILEAMAYGIPVVTTSEGVEGIPAQDGLHCGISDDDTGLISRAVELLRSPSLQETRRTCARELLENHCGPTPTLNALEKSYTSMTSERTL